MDISLSRVHTFIERREITKSFLSCFLQLQQRNQTIKYLVCYDQNCELLL